MTFNINTANSDQLQTVKGLGEKMVARILVWRDDHGFDNLVDVMQIKGIKGSVYAEMRKMGVVCKDALTEQEEEEMKKKDDVLALVRHLCMVYVMGNQVHGEEWAKVRAGEVKDMWMRFSNEEKIWDMAKETAKEKFKDWQYSNELRVYDIKSGHIWVSVDDERLLEMGKDEAAMNVGKWMGVNKTIYNYDERMVYEEMVEAIYLEDDHDALKAQKAELTKKACAVYNPVTNLLLVAIEEACAGGRTRDNLARIHKAERMAERLWTRAWYEAQTILQEEAAEQPSEGLASIDNSEDKTDTMLGDLPEAVQNEYLDGLRYNFHAEPNWMQIYYCKEKAEVYVERFKNVLRELCHIKRGPSTLEERKLIAVHLKQASKMIKDVFHQNDYRMQLAMEGVYLGMVTKEKLVELDKAIALVFRILMPHWQWGTNPLKTWEELEESRGRGDEARATIRKRAGEDKARIDEHLTQKEMSMMDFGHVGEDGSWEPSTVSDDNSMSPEEQAMINEVWFE